MVKKLNNRRRFIWQIVISALALIMIHASISPAGAMTFKPAKGQMWDVWVFHHDGRYYLFYDHCPTFAITGLGLATSDDGVHWKDQGIVIKKPETAWGLGTGFVWKSPEFEKDGQFQCNFTVNSGGQHIYFAESTDLFNWEVRQDIVFEIDPRWYKTDGRWDCIATTPRPEGGYYGYWTASPKDGSYGFGFGETMDGVHWRARKPPKVDWGSYADFNPEHCEVGGVAVIAGKHRAILNFSRDGSHMLSLIGDRPEGPFALAKKNPVLFEGDAHFARFFSSPDGPLVVHHVLAKENEKAPKPWDICYMAPMKRAVIDKEGILRLAYWEGNEVLKDEAVEVKTPVLESSPAILEPRFDVDRGFILEGTIQVPNEESALLPGVYLESGEERPTVIRVLPNGVSQIGTVKRDGSDFQPRKAQVVWAGSAEIDREMDFGPTARFRILVRHGMLEFYLDDILFHIRSLTKPATGKIGIVGAPGSVGKLKAWQMNLQNSSAGHAGETNHSPEWATGEIDYREEGHCVTLL